MGKRVPTDGVVQKNTTKTVVYNRGSMQYKFLTTNVILYCTNWDLTVQFYRDRLRLPVIFSAHWFMEFRLTGTSRLSIIDERHASIKSCGHSGITIALQVKDIDKAREHVAAMGLKPTAIKRHPWNARVFYVFDPEGRRIEMWQPLGPEDTVMDSKGCEPCSAL